MHLEARNLFKSFPDVTGKKKQTVISNLSVSLKERECLGIIGRSGCGKTTVLRILAGLLKPDGGTITINGDLDGITKHRVAFIFQEPHLLPWRTIRDNIILGYQVSHLSPSEKNIDKLLLDIGLSESGWKYPHEVSGGMQSRCAMARALVVASRFLFMDEPFGNLDPATREELQKKVKEAILNEKRCAILVTHSIEEALFLCNRLLIFRDFCGGVQGKDFIEINDNDFDHAYHPSEVSRREDFLAITDRIVAFLRKKGNDPTV